MAAASNSCRAPKSRSRDPAPARGSSHAPAAGPPLPPNGPVAGVADPSRLPVRRPFDLPAFADALARLAVGRSLPPGTLRNLRFHLLSMHFTAQSVGTECVCPTPAVQTTDYPVRPDIPCFTVLLAVRGRVRLTLCDARGHRLRLTLLEGDCVSLWDPRLLCSAGTHLSSDAHSLAVALRALTPGRDTFLPPVCASTAHATRSGHFVVSLNVGASQREPIAPQLDPSPSTELCAYVLFARGKGTGDVAVWSSLHTCGDVDVPSATCKTGEAPSDALLAHLRLLYLLPMSWFKLLQSAIDGGLHQAYRIQIDEPPLRVDSYVWLIWVDSAFHPDRPRVLPEMSPYARSRYDAHGEKFRAVSELSASFPFDVYAHPLMDPNDVPSLCLTWSVSDDLDVDDKKWTRDLVPNGSEKNVTGQDARGFVAARFLDACFAKSADGLRSFLGGLYDVVQPEALMLLSARELELQLCGAPIIDSCTPSTRRRRDRAINAPEKTIG